VNAGGTALPPLFGHDAAAATLLRERSGGRLHHAWLIAGPQGIGKRSFAEAAALRILAEAMGPPPLLPGLAVEAGHPAASLIAAGSHPDYRFVEREVWEKDRIVAKQDRAAGDEPGRNIRIAQIRSLIAGLEQSGSLSRQRVIVIDSLDDLEASAANALLKSLEEPPAGTLFLLVSHAPDRLLPTIRSRCRLLRLAPLAPVDMKKALRARLPDADADEIAALIAAGEGAPGRALAFHGLDLASLDAAMAEIARDGDPTNARRSALAQKLALKAARPRYELFLSRVPSAIAAEARRRRGPALARALESWEAASALAGRARRVNLDQQATVFELSRLLATLARR
jgi:DNA polymerase-3 subunit delta'